jgi:predicted house-cleaning noncanonical NTP pyrophosphatase (MazG superfamily)
MKKYQKLVRDNIPGIIEAAGESPVTRILDDKEYLEELVKKLREEVEEFAEARSVEELADVKEVIIAIREALGIHAGDLEEVRRNKARKNGRFKQKIYLEDVKSKG